MANAVSFASLGEWLSYIEKLHPKAIAMGLERVRDVARRMSLTMQATVFTVAGTNGKGSTCAMLESILLAAGYRVALYTSPHLVRFNERARLGGQELDDASLVAAFALVEQARGDTALTYFEISTLAILHCFTQWQPDVVILEVGLGGRLDAVNIIDADCSIVTSIDIDHTEFLGDTRDKIGWEKAHIFRHGRPAICSDPVPPAGLVDHANAIGADLWLFGRDFNYSGDKQQWSYGGRQQRRASLAYPSLRGTNQLLNAAGVLAALEALRQILPVSQQAVRQGLATVELAGRFQVLPGRPTVILDVGHNPHAAAHLARNLDQMGFFSYTWAVMGMLRDKDIGGVIGHLLSRVDHWLMVDLHGPRGAGAEQLEQILLAKGFVSDQDHSVSRVDSAVNAFVKAREMAGEGDRILVFGSFHTVGQVMEYLNSPRP